MKDNKSFNLISTYANKEHNFKNDYSGYTDYAVNDSNTLTVKDVINTTTYGFLIILALGVVNGFISYNNPSIGIGITIVSTLSLLAMWIILLFKKVIKNPKMIFGIFTVLEGLSLGGITALTSMADYGSTSGGQIVTLAVLGTFIVFTLCLFLFRANIITFKRNSRARKILYTAIAGFGFLVIADLLVTVIFTGDSMLWGGGILPLLVGIVGLTLASLSLIDDFSVMEEYVEDGVGKEERWMLSVSLMSSIVWVYIELLRIIKNIAINRS